MRKRIAVGFLIGIALLLIDGVTKWVTYSTLSPIVSSAWNYPYGGVGIFDNILGVQFSIVHATNKGAAWGAFPDQQLPLLVLRIVLIIGLTIYLLGFNRQKAFVIPMCLLIFGALGNVIDTLVYGHVIDMFKFVFWGYHYPIFNVADSAITVGIVWLFLASFVRNKDAA